MTMEKAKERFGRRRRKVLRVETSLF